MTAASRAPSEGCSWRYGTMRHLWEALRWGRSSSGHASARESSCDSGASCRFPSVSSDDWAGGGPGSSPVSSARMGTKCSAAMPTMGSAMRRSEQPQRWRRNSRPSAFSPRKDEPITVGARAAAHARGIFDSQAHVSLVLSSITDSAEAVTATLYQRSPSTTASSFFGDELLLQVHVRNCSLKGLSWIFDLELSRTNGIVELQLQCSLGDLERIHNELHHAFLVVAQRKLEFPKLTRFSSLAMSTNHLQELCTEKTEHLQVWFDSLISAQLAFQSDLLVDLLQIPWMVKKWIAQREPNLLTLVDCYQHIIVDIVDFLLESPRDWVFASRTCTRVAAEVHRQRPQQCGELECHVVEPSPVEPSPPVWELMYQRRWTHFHACKVGQGLQDWRTLYEETLTGLVECTLEVYDREKKPGFAMAAMIARVSYDRRFDCYVVRYVSVSEVPPEFIDVRQTSRLRLCPDSVRDQLRPFCELSDAICCAMQYPSLLIGFDHADLYSTISASYPYRVLQGIDGLSVGCGVELQWKMQFGSPFGWWFAHLEALEKDLDNKRATATITFTHFPESSRWYRLRVRFGESEICPCAFGGYTGGIRPVTDEEQIKWMSFFPKVRARN